MSIKTILASAKRHSEEVITPNIELWNQSAHWPREASDKAAKEGLLGLYCPKLPLEKFKNFYSGIFDCLY